MKSIHQKRGCRCDCLVAHETTTADAVDDARLMCSNQQRHVDCLYLLYGARCCMLRLSANSRARAPSIVRARSFESIESIESIDRMNFIRELFVNQKNPTNNTHESIDEQLEASLLHLNGFCF